MAEQVGEKSKAWKTIDGDLELSTLVGEHTFLIKLYLIKL